MEETALNPICVSEIIGNPKPRVDQQPTDAQRHFSSPASSGSSSAGIRNSRASYHLDLVRGLAAFAVLAYHIRYRFFVDFQDLQYQTLLAKGFYFATAFGHDAVMVFFVLSGLLISSAVSRAHTLGRWSWGKYSVDRLTRLYVVLVPGLILTLMWDVAGLETFGTNAIYTGELTEWKHDYFDVESRMSAETLLGNVAFIQTILVEPFGSNEPLWSLAYEFWYYLLFPCLYFALAKGPRLQKSFALLLIAGMICLFVGRSIVLYFPIWLLGALVGVAPKVQSLSNVRCHRFAAWSSLLLFVALMITAHLSVIKEAFGGSVLGPDYLTALGFSVFLYVLIQDPTSRVSNRYARFAQSTSGISYTLYVVHMPLLIFLRAALIPGQPWQPDLLTIGFALLLFCISLIYAYGVASIAEFKTPQIRQFVKRYVA